MKPELTSSDAFWILSCAYRDASDSTLATIRTGTYVGLAVMPCVFLFFRSIELALKSVLVHHDVPEHEIIRTLGHRIASLLLRVESFTDITIIGISRVDRQLLDRFSDDYANKSFEYSNDWGQYRHLEDLQSLAQRVCDTVCTYERAKA